MPEPPEISIVTVHLFETLWLSIGLIVLGAGIGILAWNRGQIRTVAVAMVIGLLGIAAFLAERLVVTPGERAHELTRELVDAAEQGHVQRAGNLFSQSALMAVGSPNNPGVSISIIKQRLELLRGRYTITSNAVTGLESYTQSDDTGVSHLHVITAFDATYGGPVRSSWVIRVEPDGAGKWKIAHVTAVEVEGETPDERWFD